MGAEWTSWVAPTDTMHVPTREEFGNLVAGLQAEHWVPNAEPLAVRWTEGVEYLNDEARWFEVGEAELQEAPLNTLLDTIWEKSGWIEITWSGEVTPGVLDQNMQQPSLGSSSFTIDIYPQLVVWLRPAVQIADIDGSVLPELHCPRCGEEQFQFADESHGIEVRTPADDSEYESGIYCMIPEKCCTCEESIETAEVELTDLEQCDRFSLYFDFGKNLNHTFGSDYVPNHAGDPTHLLPELLQCVAKHLKQPVRQGGYLT